jgi:hypothetical protein
MEVAYKLLTLGAVAAIIHYFDTKCTKGWQKLVLKELQVAAVVTINSL